MKCWLTLILLSSAFCPVLSQSEISRDVDQEVSVPKVKKEKKDRYVVFPVVVKSPEYIAGAGGAGSLFFRLDKDSTSRTSNFKAVAFATLRNQLVLASEGNVFFPGENYILRTVFSVSRFPDRFWGLGNTTANAAQERYSISQFDVFPQLMRNIVSNFYVGIGYEIQNVYRFDYNRDGTSLFDQQQITGRFGGKISGTGLLVAWDGRNNAFSPSRGFYFQYYAGAYRDFLGSDFNFFTHTVDVRKYFPLGRESVLAFQFNLISTDGDVPVRNLANIGSNSYMRGYYEGRFADRDLIAFQAEVRMKLYKRWGFTTFAGCGKVAGRFAELWNARQVKPTVGLGIRFAIKPAEKLNLRVDAGFGKQSQGTYLNLGEAF